MTLGVTAFAFAMTFGVASAAPFNWYKNSNSTTVRSTNNTTVNNHVNTSSNTGNNMASGGFFSHSFIGTGGALSQAEVDNTAGSNSTIVGDKYGKTKVTSTNNTTMNNTVNTSSNTGGNAAWGGAVFTGNAGASSGIMNMIGSNWTFVK